MLGNASDEVKLKIQVLSFNIPTDQSVNWPTKDKGAGNILSSETNAASLSGGASRGIHHLPAGHKRDWEIRSCERGNRACSQ